jgi:hypothetical protein
MEKISRFTEYEDRRSWKIRLNTCIKIRIEPRFILQNRDEWRQLKRLDYLIDMFGLIFQNFVNKPV